MAPSWRACRPQLVEFETQYHTAEYSQAGSVLKVRAAGWATSARWGERQRRPLNDTRHVCGAGLRRLLGQQGEPAQARQGLQAGGPTLQPLVPQLPRGAQRERSCSATSVQRCILVLSSIPLWPLPLCALMHAVAGGGRCGARGRPSRLDGQQENGGIAQRVRAKGRDEQADQAVTEARRLLARSLLHHSPFILFVCCCGPEPSASAAPLSLASSVSELHRTCSRA